MKLDDAKAHLRQLQAADDAVSFRAAFNAFIPAARAITFSMQKEGAKVTGFKEWYEKKQDEMKNDELLKFINDVRIEDLVAPQHSVELFRLGTKT